MIFAMSDSHKPEIPHGISESEYWRKHSVMLNRKYAKPEVCRNIYHILFVIIQQELTENNERKENNRGVYREVYMFSCKRISIDTGMCNGKCSSMKDVLIHFMVSILCSVHMYFVCSWPF